MPEMTNAEKLEVIQISISQAQEKVELLEALQALDKNKHFKKVFKDHLMDHYCRRLVEMKASPAMQDDANQRYITSTLDAIGQLAQYMLFIQQEGYQAKNLIAQNEAEIDWIENGEESFEGGN
jgi:hypothetical protein